MTFPDETKISPFPSAITTLKEAETAIGQLQRAHSILADYDNIITTATAAYTVATSDTTIICTSTLAFTVTLPVAVGSNRRHLIKNINTGVVTVDGDGAETIDGATTATATSMACIEVLDYALGRWVIV